MLLALTRVSDLHLLDLKVKQVFSQGVRSCTISRWIRNLMQMSCIDISVFKSHSTRAASTSAAIKLGVSVKDIIKTANWTSESIFKRFYLNPVNRFGKCCSIR